jgi:hypothetical protein
VLLKEARRITYGSADEIVANLAKKVQLRRSRLAVVAPNELKET